MLVRVSIIELLTRGYLYKEIAYKLQISPKGEFTFVPSRAGWWALTAIPESKQMTRSPEGKKVKAELGGVLWIRCADMK